MDVPDAELDEEAIVDNGLHDLRTMISLAEEERDVVELLKQLHERNTIAFPFDLSESEPILTQDLSQMMDTDDELDHSQQTNSSVSSGPVLPQDLVDCADFDELILECNEDTSLSQSLNQENLNSISQVLNKFEEHSDESEDLTQEHEKSVPQHQLLQTFTSKSSPKRDSLEDIRDFVDEYWTTKFRELFLA